MVDFALLKVKIKVKNKKPLTDFVMYCIDPCADLKAGISSKLALILLAEKVV